MTGLTPLVLAGVVGGIGTAVSAVGAIKQGNAANAAAKFNAQVASNNATSSRAVAAENAQRERRNALRRQGTMRANMGSGAAWDLIEDQAMEDELGLLSIIHEGDLQASNFETQSVLERSRGVTAQQAGRFGAASTLLTGGASAFTTFGGSPDTPTGGFSSGNISNGSAGGVRRPR